MENIMINNICYYPPQSHSEYIKNTRGDSVYNAAYNEDNIIEKGKEKSNWNFNFSPYFSDEKDEIDGIKKNDIEKTVEWYINYNFFSYRSDSLAYEDYKNYINSISEQEIEKINNFIVDNFFMTHNMGAIDFCISNRESGIIDKILINDKNNFFTKLMQEENTYNALQKIEYDKILASFFFDYKNNKFLNKEEIEKIIDEEFKDEEEYKYFRNHYENTRSKNSFQLIMSILHEYPYLMFGKQYYSEKVNFYIESRMIFVRYYTPITRKIITNFIKKVQSEL